MISPPKSIFSIIFTKEWEDKINRKWNRKELRKRIRNCKIIGPHILNKTEISGWPLLLLITSIAIYQIRLLPYKRIKIEIIKLHRILSNYLNSKTLASYVYFSSVNVVLNLFRPVSHPSWWIMESNFLFILRSSNPRPYTFLRRAGISILCPFHCYTSPFKFLNPRSLYLSFIFERTLESVLLYCREEKARPFLWYTLPKWWGIQIFDSDQWVAFFISPKIRRRIPDTHFSIPGVLPRNTPLPPLPTHLFS